MRSLAKKKIPCLGALALRHAGSGTYGNNNIREVTITYRKQNIREH